MDKKLFIINNANFTAFVFADDKQDAMEKLDKNAGGTVKGQTVMCGEIKPFELVLIEHENLPGIKVTRQMIE